ncbi:cell wall hydrolase [Allosphingosinicella indica]|uniref:Cell Wall Hydrolase n=1 Tax=Allosphingosinicella indica TaxID=941907 RepID=A0A1X7GHC1_9SPHN|nr:cell wall hydrolase [Allosphingosinicella indica]SMF69809.1 Cell Wall Hydrolase [Allosphingosinicella indica]
MDVAKPRFRLPALERRHWAASVVLAGILGLNVFAGISLLGGNEISRASAKTRTIVADPTLPPQPEPMNFRTVAPQDAVAINAAVPLATGPNPAARAFVFPAKSDGDRTRALDCLTSAIYYEAATEPTDGQRAVAQVVLNRVRHPAFPKTVCGVVYQGAERSTGCQFTFTCDGSLRRLPMASYWDRARKVAAAALAGEVYAPVGYSTHYHTNWVVPYWSSSLVKLANVGTHIFYRWSGGWGKPASFGTGATGSEPTIDLARLRARVPTMPSPNDPDALAAAAAAAAKKAGQEEPTGSASLDSFQRAVLRRYEPVPGAAVASLLAEQAADTQPDAKASASHRWAMAGDGTAGAPLGRAPAAAADAKAETSKQPVCLEGVKRWGTTPGEDPKAVSC